MAEIYKELKVEEKTLRECGPEILELEEMFVSFESAHSLAELILIVDLTPEEAPNNSIRESARKDMVPIVSKLNKLKNETNIVPEKYEELRAKYMRLSRAVGIINNNKVDHNR